MRKYTPPVLVSAPDFKDRDGLWVRTSRLNNICVITLSGRKYDDMLTRCAENSNRDRWPSYADCRVDFKDFQDFADWHTSQIGYGFSEWHLDKDLLVKGSRCYSRETCCLVPPEINKVILKNDVNRGEYPLGVNWDSARKKFKSQLKVDGRSTFLGRFKSVEEAFEVYKQAKEKQIRLVAERYRGVISPEVFNALINYRINITD